MFSEKDCAGRYDQLLSVDAGGERGQRQPAKYRQTH